MPWLVKRLATRQATWVRFFGRCVGFFLRTTWRLVRSFNRQILCFPIYLVHCSLGRRYGNYIRGAGGMDSCGSDSDSDIFSDSEKVGGGRMK
jgi:hypothetical protein